MAGGAWGSGDHERVSRNGDECCRESRVGWRAAWEVAEGQWRPGCSTLEPPGSWASTRSYTPGLGLPAHGILTGAVSGGTPECWLKACTCWLNSSQPGDLSLLETPAAHEG